MRRTFLLLIIFIGTLNCFAQKRAWQSVFADDIKAETLEQHLEVLASDEYEGRETGEKGQKLSAEYLANFYKALGLPPVKKDSSYYQTIPLVIEKWGDVSITANEKSFTFLEDFYAFGRTTEAFEFKAKQVVFGGYGIKDEVYNDYKNIDVKNKIVVVLAGEPTLKNGNFVVGNSKEASKWSGNWRSKIETAKSEGAKALLVVRNDIETQIERNHHSITSTSMKLVEDSNNKKSRYIPTFYISKTMAESLLPVKFAKLQRKQVKKAAKKKTLAKAVKSNVSINVAKETIKVEGENVFGYIEGSDLKDELIVLTAHYDHLGVHDGKTFNGADDNGTGTVALMEIAESFVKAKEQGHGPRRSILIFNNAAEEKGLLGSKHYTNFPLFPLEKTVACLNIDMIGRLDPAHEAKKDTNYVYVIGTDFLSTDLHKINERANRAFAKLNLDYAYNTYDDPNRFYYRSDHYNFVQKGIPSIFYFSGVHKDYHKHTDTEDKIVYPKVESITKLVFHTAWELANRDERIKVDVVPPEGK